MSEPVASRPMHPESRGARLRRWLRPGMGLKRWLVLIFVGELLIAFAGALILRALYREVAPEGAAQQPLLYLLTLQFLPLELRPVVLLGAGVALFAIGLWRLMDALLEPFGRRDEPLVELVYQKRSLARGPRVVALGGGTGLSTLLRGLKGSTSNITAIVNVADDGGSSGKLRDQLGIAPMGDIRNCIAALADAEAAMTRLLQYRFPEDGAAQGQGVGGHAFGNLLIAALSAIEDDFEEGVRLANRVLAVRGQVVPAATVPLTLHARLADGRELAGQSRIARETGIERVWVSPPAVRPSAEAIDAISSAELIVLGPGSLYTSLLPTLLLPELRAALAAARAPRVYVCNVAIQIGETQGYSLGDHLDALDRHGSLELVDVVLANDNFGAHAAPDYPAAPVRIDRTPGGTRPEIVLRDVVDDTDAHHHDPLKLADAVLAILDERAAAHGPTQSVARSA